MSLCHVNDPEWFEGCHCDQRRHPDTQMGKRAQRQPTGLSEEAIRVRHPVMKGEVQVGTTGRNVVRPHLYEAGYVPRSHQGRPHQAMVGT